MKCKKQKRTIRKWHLDRYRMRGLEQRIGKHGKRRLNKFSESIRERVSEGMSGSGTVSGKGLMSESVWQGSQAVG